MSLGRWRGSEERVKGEELAREESLREGCQEGVSQEQRKSGWELGLVKVEIGRPP